jgi:hypothetical protein
VKLLTTILLLSLLLVSPALAQDSVGPFQEACKNDPAFREANPECLGTAQFGEDAFETGGASCEGLVTAAARQACLERGAEEAASATATSSASAGAAATQYSAPAADQYVATPGAAELPPTGGSSLLALAAGALLVIGGLFTRRIF